MKERTEKREEFGGYLPLELPVGGTYFDGLPAPYVSAYNSGRTALYAAILSLNARRVWLPYFDCPGVWNMLKSMDSLEILPYYLDDTLLPADVSPVEGDVLIVVNYYGIMDKSILDYVEGKSNVIIDNAQAFFCPPVLRQGVLNLYSCRKFVGVGDGAYLIGPGQRTFDFEEDVSSLRCGFLTRSIEQGTNAAYEENLKNEDALGRDRLRMSRLTARILEGTDYARIQARRQENFKYVHQRMGSVQLLPIETGDHAGYCYPLLLDCDVRSEVIGKKLYVPTLWKELINESFEGKLEYLLSKNMLCLPVDQRYNTGDMEQMCDIVDKILERGKAL